MNNSRLLTIIGTAIAGSLFQANAAHAIAVSLNQATSNSSIFNYNITLDANETLSSGDSLVLTGLGGVTNATGNSTPNGTPFVLRSGLDPTAADFVATGSFTGALTFTDAITLTAPDAATGDIGFSALTGGAGGGSFDGIAQGPVSASVPFEFSPTIGLLTVFGIVGLNHYRKKFEF